MAGWLELTLVLGLLALGARAVSLSWQSAIDDPHPAGDWEFLGAGTRPVHAVISDVVATGDEVLIELRPLRGVAGALPTTWLVTDPSHRARLAFWCQSSSVVALLADAEHWDLRCAGHDVPVELLASPVGPFAD